MSQMSEPNFRALLRVAHRQQRPHGYLPMPQLAVLIGAYLAHLPERQFTRSSIKTYRQRLSQFAEWLGATDRGFSRLSFIEYLTHLQEQGQRPRTIRPAFSAIRDLAAWMKTQGLDTPDLAGVHPPVLDPPRRYYPTDDDMRRMWGEAEAMDRFTFAERFARAKVLMLLTVVACTAIRRCELLGIRTSDVRTEVDPWQLAIRKGKGMKYREIPINPEARALLADWLEVRAAWVREQPGRARNNWLLPVDQARGIGHTTIDQTIARLNEALGMRALGPDGKMHCRITLHCIRHWAASRMASQPGVSLATISEILGHASIMTTQIYLHGNPEQKIQAVGGVSLNGGSTPTPEGQGQTGSAPEADERKRRLKRKARRRRDDGESPPAGAVGG